MPSHDLSRIARPLTALALILAPAAAIRAQSTASPDITGTWQGTLQLPIKPLRIVLKIDKAPNGTLTALNYSIDQGGQPMPTSNVTLHGHDFAYTVPSLGGTYTGQLSPDTNSITGNWAHSIPLNFTRATPDTAWAIPAPPPPPRPMTDPDPSFQVATIKPTDPAHPAKYFRVSGRTYSTHGTSLADLIQVVYGIHPSQLLHAPDWVRDDKFDLTAISDAEGDPSAQQWLIMLRKLITTRFALTFHHEQQPLSTYVLTVAPSGPKNLTPSQSTSPLPSLSFNRTANGLVLPARNTTLGQFTQLLQQTLLDRPVVDDTNLPGRFDFLLTFAPSSNPGDHAPSPTIDAPSLTEALQQQLGLKLTVEKLPTDILVIDHVDHPSPN